MAITASVVAKRDELVQSARLLGKKISRWTFGERGPDLQVTLADLEQFLRPLMAAMAGGFLAVSAAEQTERLPETRPCPTCGHECSQEERERTIAAEQGPFTWAEPVCHCPQCERAFFPQRTALKIGQRGYSPAMIDKITFAGTSSESGQKARRALFKLAG